MDPASPTPPTPSWVRIALSPSVVRRSLMYTVIVGAILIVINHGDALLRGDLTAGRVGRMVLTLCVPYAVSTLSSVGAVRTASRTAVPGMTHTRAPTPGDGR